MLINPGELLPLAIKPFRNRPPAIVGVSLRRFIAWSGTACWRQLSIGIARCVNRSGLRTRRRRQSIEQRSPPRRAPRADGRRGNIRRRRVHRRAIHCAARKHGPAKRLSRPAPWRRRQHPTLRESKGHAARPPLRRESRRRAPRDAHSVAVAPRPARPNVRRFRCRGSGKASTAITSAPRSHAASIDRPNSTRETGVPNRYAGRERSLAAAVSQFAFPQLRRHQALNLIQRFRWRSP